MACIIIFVKFNPPNSLFVVPNLQDLESRTILRSDDVKNIITKYLPRHPYLVMNISMSVID